jgi:predicted nucleic acid-binding protein
MPTRGRGGLDLPVDTSVAVALVVSDRERAARSLLAEVASRKIAGGSVCAALVGAAANQHGLTLATRDRRALDTYRALEVRVELIG